MRLQSQLIRKSLNFYYIQPDLIMPLTLMSSKGNKHINCITVLTTISQKQDVDKYFIYYIVVINM